MPTAQPNTNHRLYTLVLQAIVELKENGGSHIRTIIDHVQTASNGSTEGPKPRNVALQVRRAIQYGVIAGMLRQKGGRVRLTLGQKNSNAVRACCGFICGKKKKSGKSTVAKSGGRKKHGKHAGGGSKSSRRSKSASREGGGDPCAPKKRSKRSGGKRRKSAASARGGGKRQKRGHSSSSGGGAACVPKAPKRKKKVRRAKKPECNVQQYSDEQNEEDHDCTCHENEDQKDSHVSFADEDQICGEQQQCSQPCPDHIERRKRSSQPPRRTSRQIRQGTPKNVDRCNPEFIPQQENNEVITSTEHVPRTIDRNKEDYGVNCNENTDYINKNFDNTDVHGTSQECNNPDCLCNIKQEPVDTAEENYFKANPDHCPERFSERKRSRDRDRDRNRDRDRDRNRDGHGNYFTH